MPPFAATTLPMLLGLAVRTRSRAIPLALAGGALLATMSCGKKPPPGLLLVTIDTCRADRIGCYGGSVDTEVLDALAERGVLFVDATAPVPLTAPSHSSLLTGLYPDRHQVRDNGSAKLPEGARTLAEILADSGFETAAFVSAFPLDRDFGMNQGFAHYDDSLSSSAARSEGLLEGEQQDLTRGFFYDERPAEDVAEVAIPWLRERASRKQPFFAWVHFFDPHAVYRPPPRFAQKYGQFSYEGEIAYVDEQIGRLLEAVGGAKNVIVCVTADHGESLEEHGEATHGLFVYQSTMRVPFLLSGPGVPAGARIDAPVSLVDIAPTLLDLLGMPALDDADGESAVPLFQSGTSAARPAVHGECLVPNIHYGWAPLRFVRQAGWKLIEAPTVELYDLAADPNETRNVAGENAAIVAEMRAEMERHAARGGAIEPEEVTLDAASRERLERLGYVGAGARPADPVAAPSGGRDPKEMVQFFNRLQEVPTLLMNGEFDKAERELLDLRKMDATNGDVIQKLALVAKSRGDWPATRDWCLEVIRLGNDDPAWRMNLAFALMQTGDSEGARTQYREVLAREPENVHAWSMLASLFSDAGQFGEALLAAERAVALEPDDAELHAMVGSILTDLGREEAASEAYDRALRLDGEASTAVNGKAILLSRGGRAKEAVALLRGMLPALEKDVETLNNLAWILTNSSLDPAEGFQFAKRARELAPNDPVILDTFGWSAVRAGHAAEGVEALERAWRETQDPEVRGHLAAALAGTSRDAEARAHARAAVASRPALERIPEIAKLAR